MKYPAKRCLFIVLAPALILIANCTRVAQLDCDYKVSASHSGVICVRLPKCHSVNPESFFSIENGATIENKTGSCSVSAVLGDAVLGLVALGAGSKNYIVKTRRDAVDNEKIMAIEHKVSSVLDEIVGGAADGERRRFILLFQDPLVFSFAKLTQGTAHQAQSGWNVQINEGSTCVVNGVILNALALNNDDEPRESTQNELELKIQYVGLIGKFIGSAVIEKMDN